MKPACSDRKPLSTFSSRKTVKIKAAPSLRPIPTKVRDQSLVSWGALFIFYGNLMPSSGLVYFFYPWIPQIRSGVVLSSSWPPRGNPVPELKTAVCRRARRHCSTWKTWRRNCSPRMRWRLWWDTAGGWVHRSEMNTSDTSVTLCFFFPLPLKTCQTTFWFKRAVFFPCCRASSSDRCFWQRLWKKTDVARRLWLG